MRLLIAVACVVAFVVPAGLAFGERAESRPGRAPAPAAPHQRNLDKPFNVPRSGYRLEGRAEFEIKARVISRARYQTDTLAPIMPVDFVVGWGRMADPAVLERLSCSQSDRSYSCRWNGRALVEPGEIRTHSANLRLIPDTPKIQEALLRVRPGQTVTLRGLLVDVVLPDGSRTRTSMTRDDSGPAGSEIVLVVGVEAS